MSSGRGNQFIIIFSSIVAVIAVALGVLLFLSHRKYAEISVTYDDQEAELQRLRALKPFPNQENLKELEKVEDDFGIAINQVRDELVNRNTPLEEVTPTQFQDRLREMLAEDKKLAEVNGVVLSDNFYLAFDAYRDQPPSPSAASALLKQLKVINAITKRLIENRVATLEIERNTVPEESGASKSDAGKDGLTRDIIRIKFTADSGTLRNAINGIVTAKEFLIIRTLEIQNEKLEGPVRTSGDALSAQGGMGTQIAGDGKPRLEFIVGKEKVSADLRVEIINFTKSETSSEQSAAK